MRDDVGCWTDMVMAPGAAQPGIQVFKTTDDACLRLAHHVSQLAQSYRDQHVDGNRDAGYEASRLVEMPRCELSQ